MLTDYIRAAMHRATYEMLTDDGTFYGEIPGFQGVYANAATLEACRDELEEVLEEWLVLRLSRNLPLPTVDGIEITIAAGRHQPRGVGNAMSLPPTSPPATSPPAGPSPSPS